MPPKTIVIRPLRSRVWKHDGRLQQAATTAFRSLKRGRDQGTEALHLLQSALIGLEGRPSGSFVSGPGGDEDVREQLFGPNNWGDETGGPGRCYFGPNTENAVWDFQSKSPLDADGIAGIETLQSMDDCLCVFFDSQA